VWRRLVPAVLLVGAALCPRAAGAASENTCRATKTAAMLLPGLPVTVAGRLCLPTTLEPKAIQLLIHGGTYNGGSYWDPAYEPDRFSYVRAATRAGYATFAVDRVGYGRSTRVPSTALTGSGQSDVVHQLVRALRDGRVDGRRWEKVIAVGHSMGSGIVVLEAATYHDVDGVVLTGMTHHISPTKTIHAFITYLQPALLDQQLGQEGYDPGYLTTRPGTRAAFFYSPADSDPGIVAMDEATKDVVSTTEVTEIVSVAFGTDKSRGIDVPVLLAVGSADDIFCRGDFSGDCRSAETLHSQEGVYFSPGACLQTYVVPGAGHDVDLSINASRYRLEELQWVDSVLARGVDTGCRSLYRTASRH